MSYTRNKFTNPKPCSPALIDYSNPLSRNILAAWIMSERGGDRIYNSVYYREYVGDLQNGVAWTGSPLGGCLRFDGSNDRVNMGNTGYLDTLNGPFTFSCWVKFNDLSNTYFIAGKKEAASTSGFYFDVNVFPGELSFYVSENIYRAYVNIFDYPIDAEKWYNLVGTFVPSSYIRLYINGVLANEETASVPSSINTGNGFTLGRSSENFDPLPGQIDDVRVWSRSLTPEEVKLLYTDPYCMFMKQRRFTVIAQQQEEFTWRSLMGVGL